MATPIIIPKFGQMTEESAIVAWHKQEGDKIAKGTPQGKLGGTGKECGDRHPIIRSGVLLGAGAKILGRVEMREGTWRLFEVRLLATPPK